MPGCSGGGLMMKSGHDPEVWRRSQIVWNQLRRDAVAIVPFETSEFGIARSMAQCLQGMGLAVLIRPASLIVAQNYGVILEEISNETEED